MQIQNKAPDFSLNFCSLHAECEYLQAVPQSFESKEEYVAVLEPLLIEESQAQLHSNWEESTKGVPSFQHSRVYIDGVYVHTEGSPATLTC